MEKEFKVGEYYKCLNTVVQCMEGFAFSHNCFCGKVIESKYWPIGKIDNDWSKGSFTHLPDYKPEALIKTEKPAEQPSKPDAHYQQGIYEPLAIIDHYGLDFYEGNILKYLLRWKHKNGVDDLRKLADYANKLYEREKKKG